jgi:cytochrome c-type biogenesis protein CcmH/NrfG
MAVSDAAEQLRCFDQALAIDPTCANAWFLKGVVLAELGRVGDVEDAAARAEQLDPQMFKSR